jgi:hypothetical protein
MFTTGRDSRKSKVNIEIRHKNTRKYRRFKRELMALLRRHKVKLRRAKPRRRRRRR